MRSTETRLLGAETQARPLRVAYVLDPRHTTREVVGSIVFDSLHYWGGRYRVVIPSDGTKIEPGWQYLLDLVDPDEIWFTDDVAPTLMQSLFDRVAPARVERMQIKPTERYRRST